MTEDKKLLLADLCSRLPYGIIVRCDKYKNLPDVPCFEYKGEGMFKLYVDELPIEVEFIKPYLRPMSSMTNEEGKELEHILCEIDAPCWVDVEYGSVNFASGNDFIDAEIAEVYIDWLNKKMFDYRGLIEKNLALKALTGMYGI